jgi:hypothetical protein
MLTALLRRFYTDPIQSSLLMAVLLIHCAFVLVILTSPPFAYRKKEHKSLIVKTIIPHPARVCKFEPRESSRSRVVPQTSAAPRFPQQKKVELPKPEVKKQEPPKTQSDLQLKKETSPSIGKKQTAKPLSTLKKEPAIADKTKNWAKHPPNTKNPPSENRAKISDSLLQQLEESIAKIENKSDKTAYSQRATIAGKAIREATLQIDSTLEDGAGSEQDDGNYTDALIQCLHQSLSLPDYGEVKIQLSLRQDGTVAKIVVLKTQSEKNRQYLQSHLTRLRFPPLEGVYANKKECAFVLTFCNQL